MTVLAMVVLVLAGSAMAAKDVNFVAVDEGAGVVAIYYDARSAPNRPRAFALDITVDSGNWIYSLSNLSLDYWAYPGSIDINDAGEVNDVGTPEADPCDLPGDTQPGLGGSGVTIEMGSLYVGRGKVVLQGPTQATTNLPQTVLVMPGNCCTFTIAGTVSSGAAPIRGLEGVTITGLPGPPVTDVNGNYTATVNGGFSGTTTPSLTQWSIPGKVYTMVQADMLNEDYTATATECLASCDVGYAYWVANGKPDCWCCRYQCRGDSDCAMTGPFRVGIPDLTDFQFGYNKIPLPELRICSDFDHQATGPFRVGIPDLVIFQTYYNQMAVPECPDTCINEWTD